MLMDVSSFSSLAHKTLPRTCVACAFASRLTVIICFFASRLTAIISSARAPVMPHSATNIVTGVEMRVISRRNSGVYRIQYLQRRLISGRQKRAGNATSLSNVEAHT